MEKKGELGGHVPVIACTANARKEQVGELLGAGMDEVVTKPFRIPDLLPKIFALIEKVDRLEQRGVSAESEGTIDVSIELT